MKQHPKQHTPKQQSLCGGSHLGVRAQGGAVGVQQPVSHACQQPGIAWVTYMASHMVKQRQQALWQPVDQRCC